MSVAKRKELVDRVKYVKRLPADQLPQYMNDPDAGIRALAAAKIDTNYLLEMINDCNDHVRQVVAQSISVEHLPKMMNDSNDLTRYYVSRRIDKENALLMAACDENEYVRKEAKKNALGY